MNVIARRSSDLSLLFYQCKHPNFGCVGNTALVTDHRERIVRGFEVDLIGQKWIQKLVNFIERKPVTWKRICISSFLL